MLSVTPFWPWKFASLSTYTQAETLPQQSRTFAPDTSTPASSNSKVSFSCESRTNWRIQVSQMLAGPPTKIYAVPGEPLATSFPPPNLPVPSSTLQSLPLLLHLDGRWGCPIPVPAEPEVIDASHEFVQCAKAPGSQNEPLKDIDSMCSGCLMILLDLAWPAWNQKSMAPRKITHPRESQRPSYSTCSSDSCLTWAMQRDNVTESASGLPSSELGSIYSQKIPKKVDGCKI